MLWGSQSCSSWAHRRRLRPCRRPPFVTSPSPPWPPAPAGRRGPSRWLPTWLRLNWNLRKNRAMHLPLTTQGTEGSCSTGSPPPPSPPPPPSQSPTQCPAHSAHRSAQPNVDRFEPWISSIFRHVVFVWLICFCYLSFHCMYKRWTAQMCANKT